MSEPSQRWRSLQRILQLTRVASMSARQQDWDAVKAAEAERRPLLEEFFAAPVPEPERARTVRAVREILASDQDVVQRVRAARAAAAEQAERLTRGRAAARAYARAANHRPAVKELPPGGKPPPDRRVIDT